MKIGNSMSETPTSLPNEGTSSFWYLGPILAWIAVGGTLATLHYTNGLALDTIAAISAVALLSAAVAAIVLTLRKKDLCTLGKTIVSTMVVLGLVVIGLSIGKQVVSAFTNEHSATAWGILSAGGMVSIAASVAAIYINHRRHRENA